MPTALSVPADMNEGSILRHDAKIAADNLMGPQSIQQVMDVDENKLKILDFSGILWR